MAVLDKHFDYVLLGKSYLSCMMSLGLLKRDKKVLLIDDDRLNYGDNFLFQFCTWEKDFIRSYGEDEGIVALANIDNYLSSSPLTFVIDKRPILLGDSPFLNLLELMRKFPEFIDFESLPELTEFLAKDNAQAEFDEIYLATIRRLAGNTVRFSGFDSHSVDVFINQCPELLQKIVRHFMQRLTVLSDEESASGDLAKTFLYLTQSVYHFQFKISCIQLELFHLFMSLLSAQFECDGESLTNDLLAEHLKAGGQFKKTTVREWKFHQGKPWSIELASFDGIVHPQHVSFFGGIPEGLPLKSTPDFQGHRAVKVVWKTVKKEGDLFLRSSNNRHFFAKTEWVGTDFPWCSFRLVDDHWVFILPTPYHLGFKTSFIQEALYQFLREQIPDLLGPIEGAEFLKNGLIDEQIFLTADIWTEAALMGVPQLKAIYGREKLSWTDGSRPDPRQKLKKISYFGPLNSHSLGLISSLGDIKDHQHYQ